MAICDLCNRDMNITPSCDLVPVEVAEVEYAPVMYGQETRFRKPPTTSTTHDGRCHDCRVLIGGYHHSGCDIEECPVCHRQLISCECDEDA